MLPHQGAMYGSPVQMGPLTHVQMGPMQTPFQPRPELSAPLSSMLHNMQQVRAAPMPTRQPWSVNEQFNAWMAEQRPTHAPAYTTSTYADGSALTQGYFAPIPQQQWAAQGVRGDDSDCVRN
jgi:hypothetical protein